VPEINKSTVIHLNILYWHILTREWICSPELLQLWVSEELTEGE